METTQATAHKQGDCWCNAGNYRGISRMSRLDGVVHWRTSESPTHQGYPMTPNEKIELKPCPFCGYKPTIESWHGGEPTKKMISCQNDRCSAEPQVTGETEQEAVVNWNTRTESAELPSLRTQLEQVEVELQRYKDTIKDINFDLEHPYKERLTIEQLRKQIEFALTRIRFLTEKE